jgi:peptide-methionine (S)-S-oxide reductase
VGVLTNLIHRLRGLMGTTTMVDADRALPGRDTPNRTAEQHFVNFHPLAGPYPEGLETAMFGLGCFWGAERKFWVADGVPACATGLDG